MRELLDLRPAARRSPAEVLTPGGSSATPMFTPITSTPLTTRASRATGSMLAPKRLQIFDETTCVVRAVPPVERVLQARVVRQMHTVPRGHLLAGAAHAAPGGRDRATTAISTNSTSPTASSERYSAPSATPPEHRSPRRWRCSATNTGEHARLRAPPVDPACVGDPWGRNDDGRDGPGHHDRRQSITVPKGTSHPRRGDDGHRDPRFCDHRCSRRSARRQCLVDVEGQTQTDGLVHDRRIRRHGGPHRPLRRRRARPERRWSYCSSTTRWTARCATRAASARCRTRR